MDKNQRPSSVSNLLPSHAVLTLIHYQDISSNNQITKTVRFDEHLLRIKKQSASILWLATWIGRTNTSNKTGGKNGLAYETFMKSRS